MEARRRCAFPLVATSTRFDEQAVQLQPTAESAPQLSESNIQEATSAPDTNPDVTAPPPPLPTEPSHEETGLANTETEPVATQSAHIPTSEAARRSDPSLGTSQQSTHHTGAEKDEINEKAQGSWKATTLTMPVKSSSRRKSSKSPSHGKATATSSTEKAPSTISNSEGKPSAKRRKISFFERITFMCTSCISSSTRTHEVDVQEGASRQVEPERQVTEKQSEKETEGTEQTTREPSSATTRE